MKRLFITSLALIISTSALAKEVLSTDVSIAPSDVEKVVRLVDKNDPGTSHKKLQIVLQDLGMSTDVSPRYLVYLGYAGLAEMGNLTANFLISDQAYEFISATRKSAGLYEVKTLEYRGEHGMFEVTYTINAAKLFTDEKELRKKCEIDFCDVNFKTSVEVTESAKVQK